MKSLTPFFSLLLRFAVLLLILLASLTIGPKPLLADSASYYLPYRSLVSYEMTQGWFDSRSHYSANTQHAYDFKMNIGTPLRASRAGTVAWIKESETNCAPTSSTIGNGVVINHDDGTATLYMHMAHNSVFVEVGNRVRQGAVIGLSGDTGYIFPCSATETYPHLHFSRQAQGGQPWRATTSVYFAEYPGKQLKIKTNELPQEGNYISHNYDAVALFDRRPVPDGNNSNNGYHLVDPRLVLRPQVNASDLRVHSIPGPGGFDGWNDDASAMHVPEGVRVTVYRDINHQGASETISNKESSLADNSIGDNSVSSLRYDGVWFFEDLNYNEGDPSIYIKKADFFTASDSFLPDNYIGNDTITSLIVPHGWQVTLYHHASNQGASRTFGAGNYPDLRAFPCPGCSLDGTWNDAASSVILTKFN